MDRGENNTENDCLDKEFLKLKLEIKTLYKKGIFEDEANKNNHSFLETRSPLFAKTVQMKDLLHKHQAQLLEKYEGEVFEARALVYEVLDYFNEIEEAQSLIAESEQLIHKELKLEIIGTSNENLIKGKVRFICAGINELYKAREYDKAEKLATPLYEFVTQKLVSTNNPYWGTIGLITYIQGKIYRGLSRYNDAIGKYMESCEAYHKRSELKEDELNRNFSQWKIGISMGLGLGFTHLRRGFIDLALQCLIPARVLLIERGGKYHQTYLNQLIASAKRCEAGSTNKKLLDEAIELLKRCEKNFDNGHDEDRHRASLELALAYYHYGKSEECRNSLKEIEMYASQYNKYKLHIQALIAQSHMMRRWKQPEKAEEIAREALKIQDAEKYTEVYCEALLAYGQALEALGDALPKSKELEKLPEEYDKARLQYEKALARLNPLDKKQNQTVTNPKISAMSHLLLTKLSLKEYKFSDAERHYKQWQKLKLSIKHTFIHEVAQDLGIRISEIEKPFIITSEDLFESSKPGKKLRRFKDDLHRWLVIQTKRKNLSQRDAINLIGTSPKTYKKWEELLIDRQKANKKLP
jgi:tetratricopeptide (TPR) repeat protein